jgi:metal-sulfur cluster biosynthetic enzyme/Fe-S cluster assembly iron-binding protein IscA
VHPESSRRDTAGEEKTAAPGASVRPCPRHSRGRTRCRLDRDFKGVALALELKPAAASEIRSIAHDQGLDLATARLRVGVVGEGSRRQFSLDLTEDLDPNDRSFESEGITIVCAPDELTVLDGAVIDFKRDAVMGAGFTFKVPDEKHTTHGPFDETVPPPAVHDVRGALYEVYDPEVGVNIVDLGLIYGLTVEGRDVKITMTMTTPACPLGEHIRGDMNQRIRVVCPGVDAIEVTTVWEPKWSSEKMTEAGKEQLGWSR